MTTDDGPGVAQRFGLANIRLEREDAATAAWLDRHVNDDGGERRVKAAKLCKRDGCGKRAVNRGLCEGCYRKWLAAKRAREG